MKQDIKVNYGQLDGLLDSISFYISSVNELADAVKAIDSLLARSSGEAVTALSEVKQRIIDLIDKYGEQLKELYSLIDCYVFDMTAEIQPLSRAFMTRADSYQIKSSINSVSSAAVINR
ncbi:MAG: hypothetical protein FWH40_05660 [Coriobacteriia bacterium]|nr:hypothetical protein [Coriobacteriia bacterium]